MFYLKMLGYIVVLINATAHSYTQVEIDIIAANRYFHIVGSLLQSR